MLEMFVVVVFNYLKKHNIHSNELLMNIDPCMLNKALNWFYAQFSLQLLEFYYYIFKKIVIYNDD